MSEEWITYETALERFGADPPTLRRLVTSGRVRTQRENRVQVFEAGDVGRALEGMGPPIPQAQDLPPPSLVEHVEASDVEKALASDAVRDLGGERWVTYQELLDEHRVRRGWLDRMIQERAIKWRAEGSQHVYLWADVERALAGETTRVLKG